MDYWATNSINHYENTPEVKYNVGDDKKFEIIEKIKDFAHKQNYFTNEIDGVKIIFTNGWALVRASNTGPNLTMRCEAQNKQDLEKLKKNIENLIEFYKNN